MTSGRLGVHTRDRCLRSRSRSASRRDRPRRRSWNDGRLASIRAMRVKSGLTAFLWPSPSSNRSYIRRPASTCWNSGTGRCSETITSVSPRTVSNQSPNSSAFDTVAESEIRVTDSGRWMITSSHTAPRNRSER